MWLIIVAGAAHNGVLGWKRPAGRGAGQAEDPPFNLIGLVAGTLVQSFGGRSYSTQGDGEQGYFNSSSPVCCLEDHGRRLTSGFPGLSAAIRERKGVEEGHRQRDGDEVRTIWHRLAASRYPSWWA